MRAMRVWVAVIVIAGCGGSGALPDGGPQEVDASPATTDAMPPDAGVSEAHCRARDPGGRRCGDGVASGTERCDGGDLLGETCQTLGFSGGALACHAGCFLDTAGCQGTGHSGLDWLVDLSCQRLEACAGELGTQWDPALCPKRTARSWQRAATWADMVGIAACGTYLASASCEALVPLEEARACREILRFPTIAVGEACSAGGVESCDVATADCQERPADGRFCERCVALPGPGEPCTGPCAADLACDAETDVCVAGESAVCSTDADCARITHVDERFPTTTRLGYFCNAAQRCELRGPGDPCRRPALDDCDVPDLTCVSGACAVPAGLGGACDDREDCAGASLACRGGTCQPALERGDTTCTADDECKGTLVCEGACVDLPAAGEACTTTRGCQAPAFCDPLDGRCHLDQETWVALAPGEVCGDAICAAGVWGCGRWYGLCQGGRCDDATLTCQPWAAAGEACPPGILCDPYAAHCEGGTCQAYCDLGEPCTDHTECNSDEAYCDGTCKPLRPDGAICTTGWECQDNRCGSVCLGGTLPGGSCTTDAHCPGDGVCDPVSRCGANANAPRCAG